MPRSEAGFLRWKWPCLSAVQEWPPLGTFPKSRCTAPSASTSSPTPCPSPADTTSARAASWDTGRPAPCTSVLCVRSLSTKGLISASTPSWGRSRSSSRRSGFGASKGTRARRGKAGLRRSGRWRGGRRRMRSGFWRLIRGSSLWRSWSRNKRKTGERKRNKRSYHRWYRMCPHPRPLIRRHPRPLLRHRLHCLKHPHHPHRKSLHLQLLNPHPHLSPPRSHFWPGRRCSVMSAWGTEDPKRSNPAWCVWRPTARSTWSLTRPGSPSTSWLSPSPTWRTGCARSTRGSWSCSARRIRRACACSAPRRTTGRTTPSPWRGSGWRKRWERTKPRSNIGF